MSRSNNYITEIDKFIGGKIYSLRLGMGLSRLQLAELIGVRHQQLQKYEKGINRISVGRLMLIAKALGSTVESFYKDLDETEEKVPVTQNQRMCIELSRNFMKITNLEHKNAINSLVKIMAQDCTYVMNDR